MKKYILIQNDGEIETNSFELIGASTKRDVAGKIGFFGSGLKYSIAYMMRNSIEFKVFSGLNEIVFTTTPEILRDQTFHRICINNTPTSYTTTMGATWTEDWFVLREIYCNAIDEDSCIVVKDMGTPQPTEGKTRIFIEMTENLKKVIERWDFYFSDERVPLFESSDIYTCFLGSNDGKGTVTNQNVKVFSKTDGVVYRRGIKVGEIKQLMYDYEFTHVNINEDRTAKDLHAMGYVVSSMFTNLTRAILSQF
jgi:histidyl-tRNA synthetase